MVRYFKCLVIFSFLLLISCQEGREAGDLLGQWRLAGSDDKYLSFSGSVSLFRLVSADRTETGTVFGNFQHVRDSLFIQCYSVSGAPSDTALVEDAFGFRPFEDIRVKIEVLDGDVLVVSKGDQTWNFNLY